MADQTFDQNHNGFYKESMLNKIPDESGIYCVYESSDNGILHRLLYIGESENIRNRIASHERKDDWIQELETGKILRFSYTLIDKNNRVRVEAAYINKHKPPTNSEYVDNFDFHKTTINTSGNNDYLYHSFTVG